MPCVNNGLYVVQGEMAILLAAMRRTRWSSHNPQVLNHDVLVQGFIDLKDVLNELGDLKDLDPNHYFTPFLEVIRAGDTSGTVTSLALSAVQKFLSYNLIESGSKTAPATLDNIADAVTHAKFVSTDQNSDGVVLIKILQVLRTVVLCPHGKYLTHESMCEIMLSCFRICFEQRLAEYIRKSAEMCLKDIVQFLFERLPTFPDDVRFPLQRKMDKGSVDASAKQKKKKKEEEVEPEEIKEQEEKEQEEEVVQKEDYINPQGVRFTAEGLEGPKHFFPHGIGCIQELFRFLISLCNPLDKLNTETMISCGLALLSTAFEVGGDQIGRFPSLSALVKDELCRNLFSLLYSERLSIFALDIQVCFLLFESQRTHLKFQLEFYLTRLTDMITSENPKITYDQKEIALESLVQLWRIPGLVTELYLNYDCDLYSPNLFEDITKVLSKNAFPINGISSIHLLSLEALLTIVDTIEGHCHNRILNERQDSKYELSLPCQERRIRHLISSRIPTHEELMAIKRKKKLLNSGTEQFNNSPKKGIQFLQEQGLLKDELDTVEIIHFLKENPRLDKKMIGEYISGRNNFEILQAFVRSFDFSNMRIDEALRVYLETFRLPGEAPSISKNLEVFADHWHKSNGEPFANADAAFVLAYAVIMLNVDQHNLNAKKQKQPMTPEEFRKNLKGVNNGADFEQEMLDAIYIAIKNDEIVMPAERRGLVKENYLWKVLLRRGAGKDGLYYHAPDGLYDHDLFSLIWSPTLAALSFVFEKTNDPVVYQKALSGFRKCAMISAHYGMSNDFDNLISSLVKFTNLTGHSNPVNYDELTIVFGSNLKAQTVLKTLFQLVHRHGDILREGWSTILNLVGQLYLCRLLPRALIEAEDFLEPGGIICLCREEEKSSAEFSPASSLLSSLYSYVVSVGGDGMGRYPKTPEEQEAIRAARVCVLDAHPEHIVSESKFLRGDSLAELTRALIAAAPAPHSPLFRPDMTVFGLELLLKVVLQNRDRADVIWPLVRDHVYSLLTGGLASKEYLLTERAIVGLLRLAIRLMRREELSTVVLQSLRMLLLLKPAILQRFARQIAYGLHELLKTSAANIHTTTDWTVVFSLLECVGAGMLPPKVVGDAQPQEVKSDGDLTGTEDSGVGHDRGYKSEPDIVQVKSSSAGWILVGRAGDLQPMQPSRRVDFELEAELQGHDPYALIKCCETLAFLVRDVAHITPFNYRACVQCIRIFVEASLAGSGKKSSKRGTTPATGKQIRKKQSRASRSSQGASSPTAYDADESDENDERDRDLPSGYHQITIQLLDLMHTLHTRTAQIHYGWTETEGDSDQVGMTSLWREGWCPLLQGIARLCCDPRKSVRMTAITYFQRALLLPDLQQLTPDEWQACFTHVLFPLLEKLLSLQTAAEELEETRVRAATLLCKVFLHHLTPLMALQSFASLWMRILDFMDQYMHLDKSDLLMEAIPESLKNMLLVMHSAQVFSSPEGYLPLWQVTWDRIGKFLPTLQEEFFKAQLAFPKPDEVETEKVQELPQPAVNSEGIVVPQPTNPILNPINPTSPTLTCSSPPRIGSQQSAFVPYVSPVPPPFPAEEPLENTDLPETSVELPPVEETETEDSSKAATSMLSQYFSQSQDEVFDTLMKSQDEENHQPV